MIKPIRNKIFPFTICLLTSTAGIGQINNDNSALVWQTFLSVSEQRNDSFQSSSLLNFLDDLNKTFALQIVLDHSRRSLTIRLSDMRKVKLKEPLLTASKVSQICSIIRPLVESKLNGMNYQTNLDEYLADYLLTTIDDEAWIVPYRTLNEFARFDFGILCSRSYDHTYEVNCAPKGSLASLSDLRVGDKIRIVGGIPAKILGGGEFLKMITVKTGHSLTLGLERNGNFIERIIIGSPSRTFGRKDSISFLSDDILYVKLKNIKPSFVKMVSDTLKSRPSITKMIIDLQDCPGGTLKDAIKFADLFVNKGDTIVNIRYTLKPKRFDLPQSTYKGSGLNNVNMNNLCILINNGTAAGAEVIAAALKSNKSGQLIGQRTLGYGTITSPLEVKSGSRLIGKIKAGELLTPERHKISGNGIEPDIILADSVNLVKFALSKLR